MGCQNKIYDREAVEDCLPLLDSAGIHIPRLQILLGGNIAALLIDSGLAFFRSMILRDTAQDKEGCILCDWICFPLVLWLGRLSFCGRMFLGEPGQEEEHNQTDEDARAGGELGDRVS